MANPVGEQSGFVGLDIIPITPSDVTVFSAPFRSIRAQGAGTLRVMTQTGATRNTNIAAGEILPIFVKQVFSSGTTATGLEGII